MNGLVVRLKEDLPGVGCAGDLIIADNDGEDGNGELAVAKENGVYLCGNIPGGKTVMLIVRQE